MNEDKKAVSSTNTGIDLGSITMPYDHLKKKKPGEVKAGEAPIAESATNTQNGG